MAYTRYSSLPSLIASLGIGSAMMISGRRIRDGMDYGYESAAGESESCFDFRRWRGRGMERYDVKSCFFWELIVF